MFITVVIPTYNRADTLKYVLASLAAQNFPKDKYEILLCDSSSTDGTKELVSKFNLPNLRHIIVENKGRAFARNAGIKNAKGDIILFTDADIIADVNLILEHAKMHEKYHDLAVVGCEVQVNTIEDIGDILSGEKPLKPIHPHGKRHLPWYFFLTGNASTSKENILKIGGFDEEFKEYGHEDLEMGYRLVKTKHHIVYNPKAINYHLHPVGFEEKCGKIYQSGKATVKFYDKHQDWDIKLKLGYTPISMGLHGIISEKSWFFKYCEAHKDKSKLCREILLQYYYISGIKNALKNKKKKKNISNILQKGEIEKEKVKKILVIRIDHLGDVICSMPFIKALRENFINAQLDMIVSSATQQALHKSSIIHELILFNPGYSKLETSHLVRFLKNRKYDIAIALSPTTASYYLAYKSHAKRRFGWIYSNRPLTNIATRLAITDPIYINYEKMSKKGEKMPHEVEQTFMLAEKLDMQVSDRKLFIDMTDEEKHQNLKETGILNNKHCIGLHLSPKWFGMDFLDKDFIDFTDKLLDNFKDHTLIITAGPAESDYADIFKQKIKNEKVIFLKDLNFKTWVSVLGHCKFVITMDTGATHAAAASGAPVVCVFEDKNFAKCSQQWYPWGVRSLLYKRSEIKGLSKEDFDKMGEL